MGGNESYLVLSECMERFILRWGSLPACTGDKPMVPHSSGAPGVRARASERRRAELTDPLDATSSRARGLTTLPRPHLCSWWLAPLRERTNIAPAASVLT